MSAAWLCALAMEYTYPVALAVKQRLPDFLRFLPAGNLRHVGT